VVGVIDLNVEGNVTVEMMASRAAAMVQQSYGTLGLIAAFREPWSGVFCASTGAYPLC